MSPRIANKDRMNEPRSGVKEGSLGVFPGERMNQENKPGPLDHLGTIDALITYRPDQSCQCPHREHYATQCFQSRR